MAGDRAVTPEKWQQVFITQLSKTGNVSDASRKAKVSRKHAYETRKENELFADAWDEALEIATDMLELEARRRAQIGVLEPVFHQGEIVGKVRKYSDTLLIFLLKAHKPEKFRDNVKHEHEHKGTIETKGTMTHDLSKLTLDELRALRLIVAKASGHDGDSPARSG